MIRRSVPLRHSSKPIARTKRPNKRKKGKKARLKQRCIDLWGMVIRASNGGRCKLAGKDHLRCSGPIQGAHCFGKKSLPAVRFELWNGWPLCAAHHSLYTWAPERWTQVLWDAWGMALYAERYAKATQTAKLDLEAVELELLEAAQQLDIAV